MSLLALSDVTCHLVALGLLGAFAVGVAVGRLCRSGP